MNNHSFGPVVIRDDDYRLFRHPTLESAIREAERLANKVPGARFAVYVPIMFKVQDGVTTQVLHEFAEPAVRKLVESTRDEYIRQLEEELERMKAVRKETKLHQNTTYCF